MSAHAEAFANYEAIDIEIQIRRDCWIGSLEEIVPFLRQDEFHFWRAAKFNRELIGTTIFPGNNYAVLTVSPSKTDKDLLTIASCYSPEALAFELRVLPQSLYDTISAAFKNTAFELPSLSPDKIRELSQRSSEKRKLWFHYVDLVTNANEQPGLLPETAFDIGPKNTLHVPQGTLMFSSGKSEKPVLASIGAFPCLIFAVYNPTTQSGLLTHLDYDVDINSLDRPIEAICSADSVSHAYLIGGEEDTINKAGQVLEKVSSHPGLKLVMCSLMNDKVRSLALNLATGSHCYSFSWRLIPEEERIEGNINVLSIPGPRPVFTIGKTPDPTPERVSALIQKAGDSPVFSSSSENRESPEDIPSSPKNRM